MFRCGEQASPISEGVAEIRINSQPCKGRNVTTWHTRAKRAPWVATVHDDYQTVEPVPPYPGAVFHTYASEDTLRVAWPLNHCTPVKYSGASSNSVTIEAIQFVGPHKILYAPVHNQSLFIQTQQTHALIDTGGDYHCGALNLWSRPLSTFPSSILHFP
jgi:hypothetical protein